VRENYFLKVGNEANVGDVVCFQGATAKNKALVAAFEQRLKKPILVSEFCHLTGAMGAALLLLDEDRKSIQISRKTAFSGLGLYKQQIPVRSEVCTLCTNHCKLSIAEVGGQPVAYGFLCGRDYEAKKRIKIENKAFDLQKSRKAAFSFDIIKSVSGGKTIGIPAALHLVENISFHCYPSKQLPVRTAQTVSNAVKLFPELNSVPRWPICTGMSIICSNRPIMFFCPSILKNHARPKKPGGNTATIPSSPLPWAQPLMVPTSSGC